MGSTAGCWAGSAPAWPTPEAEVQAGNRITINGQRGLGIIGSLGCRLGLHGGSFRLGLSFLRLGLCSLGYLDALTGLDLSLTGHTLAGRNFFDHFCEAFGISVEIN